MGGMGVWGLAALVVEVGQQLAGDSEGVGVGMRVGINIFQSYLCDTGT